MSRARSSSPAPADAHRDDAPVAAGEVRSVARALRVLGLIEANGSPASLTDLARASALPTSTVLRLLHTLEAERFVARAADGRWSLGATLARLGLAAARAVPLHERAVPVLEALSASTGETASLAVQESPGRAVYVRQCASAAALRHEGWLGRPFDCRRTATGRALAGRVEADGGCATRRTRTLGVSAASSPVHDTTGAIVGAITVTGPSARIDDAALGRVRRAAIEAARTLTLEGGGRWPHDGAEPVPPARRAARR